ncbi:MAG: NADH-quinone oxidoreductase subunit J [Holosporales bacterium]
MIADLLFYGFSFALLMAALFVVFAKNPIVSVLSLILAFFYAAGLFILLEAEYLAFSLIIVYVGAVAVLFLFSVMLLNIQKELIKKDRLKNKKMYIVLALLLIIEMIALFVNKAGIFVHDDLSIFSMDGMKNLSNLHAIGALLYTHHFLAFQLSGIVLLIAMISAIVLVHENKSQRRRQNVRNQLQRTKENSLEIVKVPFSPPKRI